MADLEKLDNAVNELEAQSKTLKEFNTVYSEIEELKNNIADNLNLLKESNTYLTAISKDVKVLVEYFEKDIKKLENDLIGKIQEIYQDNKNFQKELDSLINTRLEKHKSDICLFR